MGGLSGQVAVVTGASQGIGEATARLLAGEGVHVALAARSARAIERIAADLRDGGAKALAVACDVGDFAQVARLYDTVVDTFGAPDHVVNNAATIHPMAHLADTDPGEWGAAIDTNVKGVYHNLRCAIPLMLEAGGGTVVNISSGAATGVLEGWTAYCASKAAVLSLTRGAHLEYGARGLHVVGLSPGTVATPMQVEIRASGLNRVSRLDPSQHIPPEWVARAVAYLCGPGGARHAGTDFSIKTGSGRAEAGLPPPGAH